MHLEQNRHSTLVEKRSLELIQELQDTHPNRIKKLMLIGGTDLMKMKNLWLEC